MGFVNTSVCIVITAVVVMFVPQMLRPKLPMRGEGYTAPGWEEVADVFRTQLDTGLEEGAAIAVFHKGELVVEFSGGYADYEAEVTWNKDTITQLFSSTKAIGALIIGMLVDRGLLAYDKPVALYWPEFAQNGKGKVTVEQLMSHQAGLPAMDERWSILDPHEDPERMGHILAAQKPLWEPGTKHGYHAMTIGLYVDQIVRRVDPLHRDVSQFFAEEVAEKFDLDFYLGLPNEENYRCARLERAPLLSLHLLKAKSTWNFMWQNIFNPNSITSKAVNNAKEFANLGSLNNPHYRSASNPSANGFSTAISAARLMAVVANKGSLEGKTLLSRQIVEKLIEPVASGHDEVLQSNTTFGRGAFLWDRPGGGYLFGHPGYGGQMAYADVERNLAWAYVTNYMSFYMGDDPRYMNLYHAIYSAFEDHNRRV